MNLTDFLNHTDAVTAQYSTEQLISFVHDIGRVLPEQYREDFLKRLKAAGGISEKDSGKDAENEAGFRETYRRVRNNLKIIDSQELTIEGRLNEEYDDWYHDCEEFLYEDNSGISYMLEEACAFIHTCLDVERYREGFEIGKQMFSMEILCLSVYGEEELSLADLVRHDLVHCDLAQVCLDTACCAYHAVSLEKRPEVLFGIIANAGREEITLEAIMQHADAELPDFEDFLTLWITYLGMKTGHDADRLFPEANGLLNDTPAAVKYAEKYITVHPGLFMYILENEKYSDANTMAAIGMRAMKLMPRKYIMRSKVALKTAEYIIKADKNESLLDKCYFAAYESDTSAINYLRALLNGNEGEKKREALRNVFTVFSSKEIESPHFMSAGERLHAERDENKPDGNTILLLRFLD